MLKIGWFSTGRGPGSRGLLTTVHEAIRRGEIDAQIHFVFSNREPGEAEGSDQFFRLARNLGLEVATFSSRKFNRNWTGDPGLRRDAYDAEVMRRLEAYDADICVLAGYMRIVGGRMCRRYTMINLHPAAPCGPAGTWQEVIWELISEGATRSGVKIHLVTEELDRGPTMTFCTYPIAGGDFEPHWKAVRGKSVDRLQEEEGEGLALFKLIRQEGVRRELPLLVETLKALADGTLAIDPARPPQPLDLTGTIEAAVAATWPAPGELPRA